MTEDGRIRPFRIWTAVNRGMCVVESGHNRLFIIFRHFPYEEDFDIVLNRVDFCIVQSRQGVEFVGRVFDLNPDRLLRHEPFFAIRDIRSILPRSVHHGVVVRMQPILQDSLEAVCQNGSDVA